MRPTCAGRISTLLRIGGRTRAYLLSPPHIQRDGVRASSVSVRVCPCLLSPPPYVEASQSGQQCQDALHVRLVRKKRLALPEGQVRRFARSGWWKPRNTWTAARLCPKRCNGGRFAVVRGRQLGFPSFPHRFRILHVAGIMVLGGAFWLALNIGSVNEFFLALRNRNHERRRVEELRRKVAELDLQVMALQRGTFEKEKSIREKFHMVRPGEHLIRLVDEDGATSPPARPRSESTPTASPAPSQPRPDSPP